MKTSDGREVYGVSGGPIERFREGWAIIPFVRKPHYWKRYEASRRFITLCGLVNNLDNSRPGITPLAPGVFMEARCGNCKRMHQREMTRLSVHSRPSGA
jgi:hypothetical protein